MIGKVARSFWLKGRPGAKALRIGLLSPRAPKTVRVERRLA